MSFNNRRENTSRSVKLWWPYGNIIYEKATQILKEKTKSNSS